MIIPNVLLNAILSCTMLLLIPGGFTFVVPTECSGDGDVTSGMHYLKLVQFILLPGKR